MASPSYTVTEGYCAASGWSRGLNLTPLGRLWIKGTISPPPPRSGHVLPAVEYAIAVIAGGETAAVPPEFSYTWPSSTVMIMSRSTWRGECSSDVWESL